VVKGKEVKKADKIQIEMARPMPEVMQEPNSDETTENQEAPQSVAEVKP
jgi:hypothetical protein